MRALASLRRASELRRVDSARTRGEAPPVTRKDGRMPHYLIQVGYNTSGLAGLVKEPQDRIEKVRPAATVPV